MSPTAREPLEVELLVSDTRRVTIEDHAAFRAAIATPQPANEIDELFDELREAAAGKSNGMAEP